MGWKASCILVNTRADGYLGTFPEHDPERARAIVRDLDLGPFKSTGMTDFTEGIYPTRGELYVGAYDGAMIVAHESIAIDCLSEQVPPLVRWLAERLPGSRMLAIALQSVVNLYGYASYVEGRLVRVRAGATDGGVLVDHGDPLPEERPLFERSFLRDGQRIFVTDIDGVPVEFSDDAYGEEFVFELARRYVGCRLDQFESENLLIEKFERRRRGLLSWLLGR